MYAVLSRVYHLNILLSRFKAVIDNWNKQKEKA